MSSSQGLVQCRWTEKMDEVLTDVLIQEVRLRGRRANNGFKSETYTLAAETVSKECNAKVSVFHVKNRLKHIKKLYLYARAAIQSSGFGIQWDGENKWLTVDESAWAEYCKDKPREVKALRKKFFPLYEALYEVFGDEAAGGEGVSNPCDPEEMPSVNNESSINLNDVPINLSDNEDNLNTLREDQEQASSPSAKPTRGQKRKRKAKDALVVAIESNGNQIGRVANAIEILANGRTGELWEALNKMETVSIDLKLKASRVLSNNPGQLGNFLSIPNEHKEQALKDLIEDSV